MIECILQTSMLLEPLSVAWERTVKKISHKTTQITY